jgi:hypothetical protein
MILAASPWIIGCAIVLTGVAGAPSPAPPLEMAVGKDAFGLAVAANAAGAAARASTAKIGSSSRRVRRKWFSFVGRRG